MSILPARCWASLCTGVIIFRSHADRSPHVSVSPCEHFLQDVKFIFHGCHLFFSPLDRCLAASVTFFCCWFHMVRGSQCAIMLSSFTFLVHLICASPILFGSKIANLDWLPLGAALLLCASAHFADIPVDAFRTYELSPSAKCVFWFVPSRASLRMGSAWWWLCRTSSKWCWRPSPLETSGGRIASGPATSRCPDGMLRLDASTGHVFNFHLPSATASSHSLVLDCKVATVYILVSGEVWRRAGWLLFAFLWSDTKSTPCLIVCTPAVSSAPRDLVLLTSHMCRHHTIFLLRDTASLAFNRYLLESATWTSARRALSCCRHDCVSFLPAWSQSLHARVLH